MKHHSCQVGFRCCAEVKRSQDIKWGGMLLSAAPWRVRSLDWDLVGQSEMSE